MNLKVARGQPDNHAPRVNQVKNKHSVHLVEKVDRSKKKTKPETSQEYPGASAGVWDSNAGQAPRWTSGGHEPRRTIAGRENGPEDWRNLMSLKDSHFKELTRALEHPHGVADALALAALHGNETLMFQE
ncbi:hypothetical protein E2C01_044067 [Portunus trituberculatus]|uniref:Uncharacterized protein n=1 Tax=Portunus trituberculatus TaxID=210409 RepID=A0A5B7FYY5_PORTR|nr:hypothetical protein [Portunus trituberculatus]